MSPTANSEQEHGDGKPSLWFLSAIEQALQTASLTYEERTYYESLDLEALSMEEAVRLKNYLDLIQLDPIAYGFRYGNKDIANHIKKITGL